MALQGTISPTTQKSVSNLVGHGSRTAKAHYLLDQRKVDVAHVNAFMEAVEASPTPMTLNSDYNPEEIVERNRPLTKRGKVPIVHLNLDAIYKKAEEEDAAALPTSISPKPQSEISNEDKEAAMKELPWGTKHPNYGTESARVPWTPLELTFVGEWCEAAERDNPDITQVAGRCRAAIVTDYPEMIQHFHVHHVVSPTRFSWGLRRYKELYKNI